MALPQLRPQIVFGPGGPPVPERGAEKRCRACPLRSITRIANKRILKKARRHQSGRLLTTDLFTSIPVVSSPVPSTAPCSSSHFLPPFLVDPRELRTYCLRAYLNGVKVVVKDLLTCASQPKPYPSTYVRRTSQTMSRSLLLRQSCNTGEKVRKPAVLQLCCLQEGVSPEKWLDVCGSSRQIVGKTAIL